jgi:hypothetical protein
VPAAHTDPSLYPPCSCVSILRPPLTRPLIGALTRSIHIDLPTASDASDTPKMKETPPLVAGIEIPTGGAVSGDAGDEESAPIGDGPTRPASGGCYGRVQRLWDDCGAPDAWRGRGSGPSARAGGLGGGKAAVSARGRVYNASAACCSAAIPGSSAPSGPTGRCVREWRGSASGGACVARMVGTGALGVGMAAQAIAQTRGELWSRARADRCASAAEGGSVDKQ